MSKKKIIRYLILVLAILIILVILLCNLTDIKSVANELAHADYRYLLLAVGVVLVYCFFYQISLVILVKSKCKNIPFIDVYSISGSEFFFNAITPFSSGGQPFQAYALKQKGMKLSDSTSVLLMNFLSYQICLNLFSIVCISVYYNKLVSTVDNLIWWIIAGFTINFIVLIGLIMIGAFKWVGTLVIKLMDLLCKIKFLTKLLTKRKEAFATYVSEMQMTFKDIAKSWKMWILGLISKTLALFVYYSVPFFVFMALRINPTVEDLFYMVAMTSFALTICIWLPTPGASGGAELAFTSLFVCVEALKNGSSDPKTIAASGMLVWRFLTYYFLIAYGFVLYILYEARNKDKQVDKNNDSDTIINEEAFDTESKN